MSRGTLPARLAAPTRTYRRAGASLRRSPTGRPELRSVGLAGRTLDQRDDGRCDEGWLRCSCCCRMCRGGAAAILARGGAVGATGWASMALSWVGRPMFLRVRVCGIGAGGIRTVGSRSALDGGGRDMCLCYFYFLSVLRHFGFLHIGVEAGIPRLPVRAYLLIDALTQSSISRTTTLEHTH